MPQDRFGASIFIRATEPSASVVTTGTFWFDTSTDTLKVATSINPSAWTAITGSVTGTASSILETSGPDVLPIGSVTDGQFLKRVGGSVVGIVVYLWERTA